MFITVFYLNEDLYLDLHCYYYLYYYVDLLFSSAFPRKITAYTSSSVGLFTHYIYTVTNFLFVAPP